MKHVIIPFTVKEEAIEEVKLVISQFISGIKTYEPDTIFYKSFQQADMPSKFIHVMTFADDKAMELHRHTAHCKAFVEALYPLCVEEPQPEMYHEVV